MTAKGKIVNTTPRNFHKTRGRLIWNSDRYGAYVRAKHGLIGQERIRVR